jgi:hypothetical protein
MTVAGAHYPSTITPTAFRERIHRGLLVCAIGGAAIYPLADIFASTRYPGFSYRDQAVSELFAIGAPTSDLVVPLFSFSSTLLLLFAIGIWMSSGGQRLMRFVAIMMALNMIDALVLWNVFPMHMRGEPQTFTDLMHGLLAIDPFLFAAVIGAGVGIGGRFRTYTFVTLAVTSILAIVSMSMVADMLAHQPTPWMGATERAAQYATNLWYAVLAVVLLRRQQASDLGSSSSRVRTAAHRNSRAERDLSSAGKVW